MTKQDVPRRILLVEDNRASSSMISTVLGMEGFQVDLAEGGEAAMDLHAAEDYVITFMDLNIGSGNRLDTTKRIREFELLSGRSPGYIIGISASGQPMDREQCLAAGMSGPLFRRAPFSFRYRQSLSPPAPSTLLKWPSSAA